MADTFTWRPTNETTGETAFRVNRVQYGDGYAAAAPDGINHVSRKWPLSFTYDQTTIRAIAAFLEGHIGISFLWKPPLVDTPKLFSCDGYTTQDLGGNVYTLAATFDERFAP